MQGSQTQANNSLSLNVIDSMYTVIHSLRMLLLVAIQLALKSRLWLLSHTPFLSAHTRNTAQHQVSIAL